MTARMIDLPEPFSETLRRVVQRSLSAGPGTAVGLSTQVIAQRLGVGHRNFQRYMESGPGNRHCPAQILPELCHVLGNCEVLDALEAAVGRVAFQPVEHGELGPAGLRVTQRLTREFSEALGKLADTVEDGVVNTQEVGRTVTELDDLIRECVTLKHWLRQQQHASPARRARRNI